MLAGFKLMIIGMVTVFIFISVMILVIAITSKLTKNIAVKEFEKIQEEKKLKAEKLKKQKLAIQLSASEPQRLEVTIPVITAAVKAYEENKSK
ncbi:MAG: OadG family protein [Deltaproteobacteria bacterium]|nr:OadG family protein [Deltaproteobacteria bacterium]